MAALANDKNWPELRQVSHKMKSTLAFVGNDQISELNREIEKRCIELRDLTDIAALIAEVEGLFLRILPELREEHRRSLG
jgi:HPt (histidine-containing phosphotransfer) domain-containing protein